MGRWSTPLFLLPIAVLVCGNKEPEPPEVRSELIHADVPLYGTEDKEFYPLHFTADDGSFGCSSRVSFGDWRFDQLERDPEWWRLENYGVFHCAVIFREADDRQDLETANYKYGFVVRIGEYHTDTGIRELWVFQSGMRPGSDYTLLARTPAAGLIKSFDVLQRDCLPKQRRSGPSLDVWMSRYCSVNTKAELVATAKKMAKLPPLGTLTWTEGEPPEKEVQ